MKKLPKTKHQMLPTEKQIDKAKRLTRLGGPLGNEKFHESFHEVLSMVVEMDKLRSVASEFCDRVRRGDVKSHYTYHAFTNALHPDHYTNCVCERCCAQSANWAARWNILAED